MSITEDELQMIKNGLEFYDKNLAGFSYTYTYRNRDTRKMEQITIHFAKSNFLHMCGVTYTKSASQFYKDLSRNRIKLKDIKPKSDGTTGIKLKSLAYLPMIIQAKVRVTEGGIFANLRFDKAVRTGKDIIAVTCVHTGSTSVLAPQSLLNLNSTDSKAQSDTFKKSHAVEMIERTTLQSGETETIYKKEA